MVMGANDAENDMINRGVLMLEEGRISPEEAITRVMGIREGKQDYH
jgi:hypothetical protein